MVKFRNVIANHRIVPFVSPVLPKAAVVSKRSSTDVHAQWGVADPEPYRSLSPPSPRSVGPGAPPPDLHLWTVEAVLRTGGGGTVSLITLFYARILSIRSPISFHVYFLFTTLCNNFLVSQNFNNLPYLPFLFNNSFLVF